MPELIVPAYIYKKKLKKNAGTNSSGIFILKKIKIKLKKCQN
jgi:hypothetical protein